jgi:hypothetical protein
MIEESRERNGHFSIETFSSTMRTHAFSRISTIICNEFTDHSVSSESEVKESSTILWEWEAIEETEEEDDEEEDVAGAFRAEKTKDEVKSGRELQHLHFLLTHLQQKWMMTIDCVSLGCFGRYLLKIFSSLKAFHSSWKARMTWRLHVGVYAKRKRTRKNMLMMTRLKRKRRMETVQVEFE